MKSLVINKKQTLTKEEKETFFQQLENNKEFFKEAIENILTIVESDPILTYQVAQLIESDYRNLYKAMTINQEHVEKNDSPSCCHTPKS